MTINSIEATYKKNNGFTNVKEKVFSDFLDDIATLYTKFLEGEISKKEKQILRAYSEEHFRRDLEGCLENKELLDDKRINLYKQVNGFLENISSKKRLYFDEKEKEFAYGNANIREVEGIKVYDFESKPEVRSDKLLGLETFNTDTNECAMFKEDIKFAMEDVKKFANENKDKYKKYSSLFNGIIKLFNTKNQKEMFDIFYNVVLYHGFGHQASKKYKGCGKIVNEVGADFLPMKNGRRNFTKYLFDNAVVDNKKAKNILGVHLMLAFADSAYPINPKDPISNYLLSVYNSENIGESVEKFSSKFESLVEEFKSNLNVKNLIENVSKDDSEPFLGADSQEDIGKATDIIIDKEFNKFIKDKSVSN